MPDFWGSNPASMGWYPPVRDEQKTEFQNWFQDNTPPAKHLPLVPQIITSTENVFPEAKTWGVLGYCLGGKMVSVLGGQEKTLFKVRLQTSPALIDVNDAKAVKIPMCLLVSKDENAELVSKYNDALQAPHHLETFSDQIHGFMSARADLKDSRVKEEYERGYTLALKWFHDNL